MAVELDWARLPRNLRLYLLDYLEPRDIGRMAGVCKAWREQLTAHHFIASLDLRANRRFAHLHLNDDGLKRLRRSLQRVEALQSIHREGIRGRKRKAEHGELIDASHYQTEEYERACQREGASCQYWRDLLGEPGVNAQHHDVNAKDEYSGDTPLHDAVRSNKLKKIDILLAYGADVNATACDGTTPLMLAENVDMAKALLDHGADLMRRDKKGTTALVHAANGYNTDLLEFYIPLLPADRKASIVQKLFSRILGEKSLEHFADICLPLIKHGARFGAETPKQNMFAAWVVDHGESETIVACIEGGLGPIVSSMSVNRFIENDLSFEAMKALVRHGVSAVRVPLTCEMLDEDLELVELLVAQDSERVKRHLEETECSPLHYACQTHNVPVARVLLNAGADMICDYYNGDSPLEYAVLYGLHEIVSLMVQSGATIDDDILVNVKYRWPRFTPLHIALGIEGVDRRFSSYCSQHFVAAACGETEQLAQILLEEAIPKKWLLLDVAASHGHIETMKMLLSFSPAMVSWIDGFERTALINSTLNGQTAAVRLLIEKGADVNHEDYFGLSAVDYQRRYWPGNGELARVLRPKRRKVEHQKPLSIEESLIEAICEEDDEKLEALLSRGFDVNQKIRGGSTLLHYAVMSRKASIVRFLLNRGADCFLPDSRGVSALDLARQLQFDKGVQLMSLLEHILSAK